MKKSDSVKRCIILFVSFVEMVLLSGIYFYFWMRDYYPYFYTYRQLHFYFKGFLLIYLIYIVLLYFFTHTYGGLKVGQMKSLDVCFSQIFALLAVNVLSYLQACLMSNWIANPKPMLKTFGCQLVLSIVWVLAENWLYRRIFPPRNILLVHGERPANDIIMKFDSRKDKFRITQTMPITAGISAIEDAILTSGSAVVLWDIPTKDRNELLKFCYSRFIRIYVMPKIPDVLIKGSEQLHLFDTPLFLTRETALRVEQRIAKRAVDIVCAVLLIIITSPFMLITAIAIKICDRGPVLYKQVRCTIGGRQFRILKFRSMRVDAEKDGVARLAAKDDDRITPVGKVIRAVRIDELPQLFNILKGDMSFIGPRPERPEIMEQYMEEMPEFAFRLRVKAGLAGYAQVYGKYNTTPYDKLKLDLTYIQNYSIWLDFKLMLLTLKILFQPESTEGIAEGQVTADRSTLQENDEQQTNRQRPTERQSDTESTNEQ